MADLPLEELRAGLAVLLEAYEWAHNSGLDPWQFSVTLDQIQHVGFSNAHLSWLICRGFLEHLYEFTPPGDKDRLFRDLARLNFRKRSRFILNAAGAAFAGPICRKEDSVKQSAEETHEAAPGNGRGSKPEWDRERLQLTFNGELLMQLTLRARNLLCILDIFQEEGWPPRIDDPIPSTKRGNVKHRLRAAIERLNKNLLFPSIRFSGDGSGESICWKLGNGNDHIVPPAN